MPSGCYGGSERQTSRESTVSGPARVAVYLITLFRELQVGINNELQFRGLEAHINANVCGY